MFGYLMYKNLLQNTTNIDFWRLKWIKIYLKDNSQFYLSGSALSDCSIQVEDNTKKMLGLS